VVQQHQGEEPGDLRVRHARRRTRCSGLARCSRWVRVCRSRRGGELAGQPDRLVGQRYLAREPLVEDQVEHVEHRPGRTRRVEALAGDGALGAGDPLGHGRLGHQEGPGDLRRGEPAHGAQRQRDRRRRAQRRMAAAAQQEQGVVRLLGGALCGFVVDPFLPAASGRLGALRVDQLAAGDAQEPRLRVVGRVVRPVPDRLDERLLHGVLGRREVCSATDEDAQDLWRQRPDLLVHVVLVHEAARPTPP
jgi:hypothetical protein